MAFEIRDDMNPKLMALAWMIGHWEGNGHCSWPGQDDFEFGQSVDFATNGGDYLHYLSQIYTLNEQGQPDQPVTMEAGFWRPQPDGSLEVVLAQPAGRVESWIGKITGAKIELTSDIVARTATATEAVTGGQRLYGQVEGDLMWTHDRVTDDVPLRSFMWGRLKRA